MNTQPQVGDAIKADIFGEGQYSVGVITSIEDGLVYADLDDEPEFCGDVPMIRDLDGVRICMSF